MNLDIIDRFLAGDSDCRVHELGSARKALVLMRYRLDKLDEAVKLLEQWTETYDRGRLYEESMDLLRKVRP